MDGLFNLTNDQEIELDTLILELLQLLLKALKKKDGRKARKLRLFLSGMTIHGFD